MGGPGSGYSWVLHWWAELIKTLIHLSADGWGWVPSLFVVWPEATQHWSLLSSLVGLMADSGRAHAKEYFPELLLPVSLSSRWATPTPASAGDPPTLAGRSGSVSYGVTAPSPGSWCAHYFVCVLQEWSLFPPVLSKSCNQISLAFKVWFCRNSSSRCRTPRLGSLTWGSEPSLQWVDFCGISVLQFVSHPPRSYGIWFYCDCAPPTVSLWLLLCLWMWSIIFGEFQCLPVDDC